ncbi:MAG: dethiobiotin synthase [Muribaculaceae bacterium]|nr:dethiobiotin synthase [Muribaculaceae bacterium]
MKLSNKPSEAIFISGIDTDAGKTYATAHYARTLMEQGLSVITQKFIQTGCHETSEDIEAHRRLLGTGPLPEDNEGLTAPVILSYPASAQLAARIDGRSIDLGAIERATAELLRRYDRVLIEGAGGLYVPITDSYFAIDYVAGHALPLVLVTNGRLGSINHTVLSLEAIKAKGIRLLGVIYNRYYDSDEIIAADTSAFVERYVAAHFPDAFFTTMPAIR